jgi:epsilon-lactone hydrolase
VPGHSWRDSFDAVAELARRQDGPGAPLLMGDSAGAGYALAVSQVLAAEGRRPGAVLISPYGDALVSDPRTAECDARDPYLATAGVRAVLTAWAGQDDPNRPEVSPLFGTFAGITRMLMFTGTSDTIHPQAHQIHDKAQTESVGSRLVVADGCVHVYPLMPIPEARRAIEMIVDFVAAKV